MKRLLVLFGLVGICGSGCTSYRDPYAAYGPAPAYPTAAAYAPGPVYQPAPVVAAPAVAPACTCAPATSYRVVQPASCCVPTP